MFPCFVFVFGVALGAYIMFHYMSSVEIFQFFISLHIFCCTYVVMRQILIFSLGNICFSVESLYHVRLHVIGRDILVFHFTAHLWLHICCDVLNLEKTKVFMSPNLCDHYICQKYWSDTCYTRIQSIFLNWDRFPKFKQIA